MTALNHNPLARSLVAAGLALVGTIASFSATTTPAQAAAAERYQVQLGTALEAPRSTIVNGVVWNCNGATCAGAVDGARPINTCVKVAKAFGPLASFTGPKGAFSADELAQCNAKAG
jgi:curli biogenesis system outer membrane secretion channel CsgG